MITEERAGVDPTLAPLKRRAIVPLRHRRNSDSLRVEVLTQIIGAHGSSASCLSLYPASAESSKPRLGLRSAYRPR